MKKKERGKTSSFEQFIHKNSKMIDETMETLRMSWRENDRRENRMDAVRVEIEKKSSMLKGIANLAVRNQMNML